MQPDPNSESLSTRRSFALEVVKRLRSAGFEALWAGGCVRDQLLGKPAKDFDVATSARPEQVIELFGERRTVPVGASFGVVMVLGPSRASGQIEVATFRSDGAYMDGRRPVGVRFSSDREDAQRRDFTINGMFYDPVSERLIDYVGGQADIRAGIIRAIGNPQDRFTEDKLRMLRAIRFAATLNFELEKETFAAIQLLHRDILQVSIERIAQEFRRMLADASRVCSIRLLRDSGLIRMILPEAAVTTEQFEHSCSILSHLQESVFEPSMVALLCPSLISSGGLGAIERGAIEREAGDTGSRQRDPRLADLGRRLKFSNDEIDTLMWLADACPVVRMLHHQPLHVIRPLLAHPRYRSLMDLARAMDLADQRDPAGASYAETILAQHPEYQSLPVTLVNGRDLLERGVPSGPQFKRVLSILRAEQLDNKLLGREQALMRLDELLAGEPR